MALKKMNCWEHMQCGRELGGENAEKFGLCPAATDPTLNGFNMGSNSGRICWLVAGTFCNESVQGTSAEKKGSCKNCDFYKQVHAEEGMTFISEDKINIFALTHIGLVREVTKIGILSRSWMTDRYCLLLQTVWVEKSTEIMLLK